MLGQHGPVSILGRHPRLSAIALLIVAAGLARGEDDPKKPEKLPPGVSEVTQEDLVSRMPSFFYFDYAFGDTPGKRLWLRVDSKHWIERYPDGMETRFRVLGRAKADQKQGTIVVRLAPDPDDPAKEKDDSFQVFIPDKGDEAMFLLFRTVEDEPKEWSNLGPMQKVE